jgi:hypothetical protein
MSTCKMRELDRRADLDLYSHVRLAVVDTNYRIDHLGQHDHVTKMRFDSLRLAILRRLLALSCRYGDYRIIS